MKKNAKYYFLIVLTSIVSCTTPYAYETNAFNDALVVEATITNEMKKHEIKLTHTFRFEESGPNFENDALVYITDNEGNKYDFEEVDEKYVSTSTFQAVANRNYQLHITTNNGKSYSSTTEELTNVNEIQNITPTVTTKEGVLGVEIFVNSFDPTNSSKFYRYEYEETYKIVAPKWVNVKASAKYLENGAIAAGEVELQPRTTEVRTCFTTRKSDNIILTKTNDLSEDRVNFPVRFISSIDHIIRDRYSILVKQYVQNLASQTFYATLKGLSDSESILSQNQPGYFSGNIKSDDNLNEKVLGFFDVSSYSEKRIFFNYADIFPKEKKPDYPYDCPLELSEDQKDEYLYKYCFEQMNNCEGVTVLANIINDKSVFVSGYDKYGVIPFNSNPTIFLELYPIQCGDCTSFSNNIKPSFWID
ncbi:hypothetical protein HNP99_000137 [Flavobacterium sp. 28A]|uniref:DUF4249 domain-containing protein n=1 Tax=Flavobacterium sp. 28A TaxID=2735895 RepID=UPI00156E6DCF|nr:DUF4249 domain-containing protein [Flavobacterium sp. 28A]NRT13812.1 hypothetical protein [Flavobacterium sp. 28A]